MRKGKLFKFILGNSELPKDLHEVFKAWLESAAMTFPYCWQSFPNEETRAYHYSLAEEWFEEYFGLIVREEQS